LTGRRFLRRCLDWSDVLSPRRGVVTSTSRTQHGYSHRPAADIRLLASGTEDSFVAPQTARSWARRFNDPQDVTWWVHLVRPGVESDIVRRGRLQAVMLRFQNGISAHSRYLHPIPPDWRECDDMTLWRYCEQAAG
jgi:hypothetical protein